MVRVTNLNNLKRRESSSYAQHADCEKVPEKHSQPPPWPAICRVKGKKQFGG